MGMKIEITVNAHRVRLFTIDNKGKKAGETDALGDHVYEWKADDQTGGMIYHRRHDGPIELARKVLEDHKKFSRSGGRTR